MSAAGSTRRARWLLREPSRDAAARLFALPYSGCGASMYRGWPRFAGDVEVCAVQLPGRENRMREEPYTSFGALADSLAEGLLPYLDRPFAFFGHCSSALAGYETTLRLAAKGYPTPDRLFVSSQVAPHQGPHGRFLEMTDGQLADEVRGLLAELGVASSPDLVALALDVLLSDVAAHKRYGTVAPVRVPCPITAIGWDADVEVPYRLMSGWSDIGVTSFRTLHGPHYGFMAGPPELLDVLATDLLRPAEFTSSGELS